MEEQRIDRPDPSLMLSVMSRILDLTSTMAMLMRDDVRGAAMVRAG